MSAGSILSYREPLSSPYHQVNANVQLKVMWWLSTLNYSSDYYLHSSTFTIFNFTKHIFCTSSWKDYVHYCAELEKYSLVWFFNTSFKLVPVTAESVLSHRGQQQVLRVDNTSDRPKNYEFGCAWLSLIMDLPDPWTHKHESSTATGTDHRIQF